MPKHNIPPDVLSAARKLDACTIGIGNFLVSATFYDDDEWLWRAAAITEGQAVGQTSLLYQAPDAMNQKAYDAWQALFPDAFTVAVRVARGLDYPGADDDDLYDNVCLITDTALDLEWPLDKCFEDALDHRPTLFEIEGLMAGISDGTLALSVKGGCIFPNDPDQDNAPVWQASEHRGRSVVASRIAKQCGDVVAQAGPEFWASIDLAGEPAAIALTGDESAHIEGPEQASALMEAVVLDLFVNHWSYAAADTMRDLGRPDLAEAIDRFAASEEDMAPASLRLADVMDAAITSAKAHFAQADINRRDKSSTHESTR